MKVAAKVFKGIEFIQVNQLPDDQREKFIQWVQDSAYIKILIEGKVVSGCVQYKDYESWYESTFFSGTKIPVAKRSQEKLLVTTEN